MLVTSEPAVSVSMSSLERLLSIARGAGARVLGWYGNPHAPALKDDGSPVTAADAAAHQHITAELAAWDPDVPIVSEEGRIADHAVRATWRRFWLVDPLDGTKEFVAGIGEFTVNIALVERGEPVLGVVYAPALDVAYAGGRALGAFKREGDSPLRRIRSRPAQPGEPLVAVESRSHPTPALEDFLSRLNVTRRVRLGSSLKFCLLAEGAADIYARLGPTMEWDVAAGDCIFRNSAETGQRISPLRYNQRDLRTPAFVLGLDDVTPCPPGLQPAVVWLTGLSGAGKSTIADRLALKLQAGGHRVEQLDGDVVRTLFPSTGFSREERDGHARRVAYLASRLERHGVFVLVSLISPYRSSRAFARALCRTFVEVHVATSLAECERRDVKGLYARARRGEITNFTGLDDPYETPERPDVSIDTARVDVETAASRVVDHLARLATGRPGEDR
jgi:3'(2'),5'-bisphosphate nucleotidase